MHLFLPFTLVVACAVVYLLILLWYGGRGRPMTTAEADSLVDRVRLNAEAAGLAMMPDLLHSLREIARDDNGREFVMVNLIKYRQKAVYPPGYSYGDDPREADARYNRAVVPLLLKRACLPVFLGKMAGRFLAPDGAEDWDSVVLVRYRSRRDFLGMCAELARSRSDIHKWASIEKTHVFPVTASFSLFLVRSTLGGLLAALGVLIYFGLR